MCYFSRHFYPIIYTFITTQSVCKINTNAFCDIFNFKCLIYSFSVKSVALGGGHLIHFMSRTFKLLDNRRVWLFILDLNDFMSVCVFLMMCACVGQQVKAITDQWDSEWLFLWEVVTSFFLFAGVLVLQNKDPQQTSLDPMAVCPYGRVTVVWSVRSEGTRLCTEIS